MTIKTKLMAYNIDTSTPEGKAEWVEVQKLASDDGRVKCFNAWGGSRPSPPETSREVELETTHIFNNQWNSVEGKRLMDWFLDAHPNLAKTRKVGYWLVQNEEMAQAREMTYKCGYCGFQIDSIVTPNIPLFCPKCVGSDHILKVDVILTLMQPVSGGKRALVSPAFLQKQWERHCRAKIDGTSAGKAERMAGYKREVEREYTEGKKALETEYQGFNWLFESGIDTRNVYFNKRELRFEVGAMVKLTPDEVTYWKLALEGFPYNVVYVEREHG